MSDTNPPRKTNSLLLPAAERLARALEKARAVSHDGRLDPVIERARTRVYDTYRGRLQYPRRELALELAAIGHADMSYRVAVGEFDPSDEETAAWLQTAEAQAIMSQVLKVNTDRLRPYDKDRAKVIIEEAARLARLRRAVYNHKGD